MRGTRGRRGGWGALALGMTVACTKAAEPPAHAGEAAPTALSMCPVMTVDELEARVAEAIEDQSPSLVQSLVLPIGWPPSAQGVEILTYRVEALATGVVAYDIHSAHVITVSPWIAKPEVVRVFPEKLGREYEGAALPFGPDEKSAQQALIDVISKCRPADAAKPALLPYLKWVENHPVRGKSLLARQPAFFAWLKGEAGKKPKK